MERILQFADSKTKRQLWTRERCRVSKYSERVFRTGENNLFFEVIAISNIDASQSVNLAAQIPYNFYTKITSINYIKYAMTYVEFYARLVVVWEPMNMVWI